MPISATLSENAQLARQVRLNYVESYLSLYNLIPNEFYSEVNPVVEKVLNNCNSIESFINTLWRKKIISIFYTKKCFEMDAWFILKERSSSIHNDAEGTGVQCLFMIILQSFLDLRTGRPCDHGIWRKDISSDFRNCTKTEHVCSKNAEEYLLQIDEEAEELAGLSIGRVHDLMTQIKKDPIFRISDLLMQMSLNSTQIQRS